MDQNLIGKKVVFADSPKSIYVITNVDTKRIYGKLMGKNAKMATCISNAYNGYIKFVE